MYSGADDAKFKGWDTRIEGTFPIFQSKEHEYGVTCIKSWMDEEHYLVTGQSKFICITISYYKV